MAVAVEDNDGDPEPGLPVYAFDGASYSGYNGTTDVSGTVTLTLPQGDYRFRADKDSVQYWSGVTNHCTVPGCTAATVTITATAAAPSSSRAMAGFLLPDPTLLLMTPLAAAVVFGRKKKGRQWAWPVTAVLLAVAVVGIGATLIAPAPGVALAAPSSAPAYETLPAPQPRPAGDTITTTRTINYSYDPLYRLTEAQYSNGLRYEYQYDAVGNRLQLTEHGTLVTQYTYDAANRLTSAGGVTYTYDDNGNLLSDGARAFAYDTANRLTQVVSGTLTTQYAYSGDGVRLAQTVNGVTTRYVNDVAASLPQVLTESTNQQTRKYLYGLGMIASHGSGTWAYQHPDGLGSVRQLSDAAGQVTLARSYTPFGKLLSQAGTAQGSFGFAGEQRDAAAGLTFLRARYYDPTVGRFLTRDPYPAYATVPSTLHRYAYVGNNPVNRVDPSGLQWASPAGSGGQWAPSQPGGASYSHRTQATAQQALTLRPQQSSYRQPSGPAFGAGPSMGGYRPSRPAYDQTQMMAQRTRAIEHINQLTRAQSRGHRQEQCGTTSFWEELKNSWREGTLLPDLGRVGLHELKTNPFWRQRITPKDIWQFARDLDRRVNDWFNGQADLAMEEIIEWAVDPRAKMIETVIPRVGAIIDYSLHKRAELFNDVSRIFASKDLEGIISNSVLFTLHASGLTDIRLTRNLIGGVLGRIGGAVANFNRNWATLIDPRVAVGSQAWNRAAVEVGLTVLDLVTRGAVSDIRYGATEGDWLRVASGIAQALPGMGVLDNVLDVAVSGREVYRGLRTGNAAQVELGLFGVAMNAYQLGRPGDVTNALERPVSDISWRRGAADLAGQVLNKAVGSVVPGGELLTKAAWDLSGHAIRGGAWLAGEAWTRGRRWAGDAWESGRRRVENAWKNGRRRAANAWDASEDIKIWVGDKFKTYKKGQFIPHKELGEAWRVTADSLLEERKLSDNSLQPRADLEAPPGFKKIPDVGDRELPVDVQIAIAGQLRLDEHFAIRSRRDVPLPNSVVPVKPEGSTTIMRLADGTQVVRLADGEFKRVTSDVDVGVGFYRIKDGKHVSMTDERVRELTTQIDRDLEMAGGQPYFGPRFNKETKNWEPGVGAHNEGMAVGAKGATDAYLPKPVYILGPAGFVEKLSLGQTMDKYLGLRWDGEKWVPSR